MAGEIGEYTVDDGRGLSYEVLAAQPKGVRLGLHVPCCSLDHLDVA